MTLLVEKPSDAEPRIAPVAVGPTRGTTSAGRGWTVVVVFCVGLGLGALWIADETSRSGRNSPNASILFWLGLLLIFGSIAVRVLAKSTDRRERLLLLVLLGSSLYVAKILRSPDAFTFSDEFVHLRNTENILRTGHLFSPNPLLPTAAYYPGLGAIAAGLSRLTGLSVFASGLILMGVVRCLLCACMFLIAEKVTGSARAAAAATLIYATNPMFLFWGPSFTYENLALPLAAFVIWWVGRSRRISGTPALVAAAVGVGAVVVTHHVAAFGLAALLAGWWLVERVRRESSSARRRLGVIALFTLLSTVVWFIGVARPAFTYLVSQNLAPGIRQTGSLIVGSTAPRQLYTSGGNAAPTWYTLVGFVAVALLMLAIPPALYLAWQHRARAPMVIVMVVTVLFPFSLLPRLAPVGVAISGRSSEFVFAGLGCVLGLLVAVESWPRRHQHKKRRLNKLQAGWRRTALATAFILIVFVGEVSIGTASYQLLPESSNPQGYPWTVQQDAITASLWARRHLGIHQRFAADKLDSFALSSYGEENTVSENSAWPVYFAWTMDADVVAQIKRAQIHYLLVDWRMTRGVPPTPGYYFSPQEPLAGLYLYQFTAPKLEKFATSNCTSLVYKSGGIQIFDVSRIANGSCVPSVSQVPPAKKVTP
jgi:hypothetical protein